MTEPVKLHLGCGPNVLPGWLNLDIEAAFRPDLVADLGKRFPLATASVDFIHAEGVLCQFDLESGKVFLAESWRVLKPGGAMRLLLPDLHDLVKRYLQGEEGGLVKLWNEQVGLPLTTGTACEVVNVGIRDLHRFFYDHETITLLLEEAGFAARRVAYQESSFGELRDLDVRSPDQATYMYYEAVKPGAEAGTQAPTGI